MTSSPNLSVYDWLDSLGLGKHLHLFVGYDLVQSLIDFNEADFVRLGVTNANDRRTMLRSLAEEMRSTADARIERCRSPTVQATGSGASNGGKSAAASKKKVGLFKGKNPVKAAPQVPAGLSAGAQPTLQNQPWFHGMITRKLAERAVKKDGDILVRERISKRGDYVLTTRWGGQALHFVINSVDSEQAPGCPPSPTSSYKYSTAKGKKTMVKTKSTEGAPEPAKMYRFEREAFPSIVELVNHHLTSKQSISEATGAIAKFPVPRAVTGDLLATDRYSADSISISTGPISITYERRNSEEDVDGVSLLSTIPSGRRSRTDSLSRSVQLGRASWENDYLHPAPKAQQNQVNGTGLVRRESNASANMYELLTDHRSLDGSQSVGLPTSMSSSSLSSLRSPDLPDPDLMKAMCSVMFTNSPFEMAQHLTRVNMRLAYYILPQEVFKKSGDKAAEMVANLSRPELEQLRSIQEGWQAGFVAGLATTLLLQGSHLAALLVQRFNSLSRWVAAAIIGAGDLAKRRNMLGRMIELAQHLQSDALADLHSFMAVMRGLQLPSVRRLSLTWTQLRRNDGSLLMLYETQLCPLALALRSGQPTHQHLTPSLPYLEPLLVLLTHTMKPLLPLDIDVTTWQWEEDLSVFGLDATLAHVEAGRALSVQCDAYRIAGTARLRGMKAVGEIEEYFKKDFATALLMSRPCHTCGEVTAELMSTMLLMMSDAAEPDTIRNTLC